MAWRLENQETLLSNPDAQFLTRREARSLECFLRQRGTATGVEANTPAGQGIFPGYGHPTIMSFMG